MHPVWMGSTQILPLLYMLDRLRLVDEWQEVFVDYDCHAIKQTVMGAIQVVAGDKLLHTTNFKAFQLALQWVIWTGLVVIDDFEGSRKNFV